MKQLQRIISGVLSLCMVLSMLPMAAWAEESIVEIPTEETLAVATEEITETTVVQTEATEASNEDVSVPAEEETEAPAVETEEAAQTEATVNPAEVLEKTAADVSDEDTVVVVASGTCGENLTWVLNNENELIISGTGAMTDYVEEAPWADYVEIIKWVVIEDGVTSIGDRAFYGCHQLLTAFLSEGLTKFGDYSFKNCSDLSFITSIPEGVVSIGTETFYGCEIFRGETIPASVTHIGEDAFRGCRYIKAIEVAPGNTRYSSDDKGVLFNKDQTVLIFAPNCELERYVIPDSVARIEKGAFSDFEDLTSVIITAGVTSIGESAFAGLSDLETIYFLGEVPEFVGMPFEGVTAKAYYPETKTSWTETARQTAGGALTWIPYAADGTILSGTCGENLTWGLDYKGTLTISGTGEMADYEYGNTPWWDNRYEILSVVIREGVTSIGKGAFEACSYLENVTIPESVIAIGDYAFAYCYELTRIAIPASVATISNRAFIYCSSLTEIQVNPANEHYSSDAQGVLLNKNKTSLIVVPGGISGVYAIPSGVVEIRDQAFRSCEKLTEVTFPASVASIGSDIFYACESLTTIRVASDNAHYSSDASGVLFNKNQTELIRAPQGISGVYTMPDGVISIGPNAFEECYYLTGVVIADSVAAIGRYAFGYVESLSSIMIPASVTFIGDFAFDGCNNLKEIWFAGSAPEFEDHEDGYQFYGVRATVYYPANDPSWTEDVKCSYKGFITWSPYELESVIRGSLGISEDYIAMKQGQTAQLHAEVMPAEWIKEVRWTVEDPAVAAVDGSGNVTAVGVGTTYVVATLAEGEKTHTARCRVDVAESLVLDGVRLSASKLTTELFSTNYTEFEILLQLPQNKQTLATNRDLLWADDLGVAIEYAEFTNVDMGGLFELRVLDDRRVAIVPTDDAVELAQNYPKEKYVASSYVTAVEVTVDGETYTSENLTLTVKQSKPKLKVTAPVMNSFYYRDYRQPLTITGGTVIEVDDVEAPDWLFVHSNGDLSFYDEPAKNASGKVVLDIYTEEWRIPVQVSVTVKNNYKAPELKLSASSVTMCQMGDESEGVRLQLLPKAKGVTLADLGVEDIDVSGNYYVLDFNLEDGSFRLIPYEDDPSEKINIEVEFKNSPYEVTLPLSVKRVPVTLKLSQSAVTLNTAIGDTAVVAITANPADYDSFDLDGRLVVNDKREVEDPYEELDLRMDDDNKLYISTNEATPDNAKYTLYLNAHGGKEVALKINTTSAAPTVKLKAVGNLDVSFPERKINVETAFKNYSGAQVAGIDYHVTESKGKEIYNEDVKAFSLNKEGTSLLLNIQDAAAINVKNTYTLYVTLTLADGSTLEGSVKIPVKQTNISLKLSTSKLTLNKAVNDAASVGVTCTTKGYSFTQPVWKLQDNKGRDAAGQLDVSWADGKLTVATNEATQFGGSYKLQISPAEGAKAVTLTISIPTEAKSAVTATIKAKGNLDVIRSGAVIVTPSYKNCLADTARTEELIVIRSDGQIVTDQFAITQNSDGTYSVAIAKGAGIDMSKKHQLQLVAKFGTMEVNTKPIALNIKMGSAKLTAQAEGTLFSQDKNSRMNLRFTSTDAALNGVARVEIKDAKYTDVFEVFDYGNGQFAIGFKDGMVPAKLTSVNLSLNVWLEGNETTKANTTLKLKVTIVK